ncbi:MAG: helicase-exonuclease AddAB subunit AddA [Lachnospiraceae bacterium]|nr:helicase-exonuclease AddAB subunit AddA [Lachnospiraceae bacterium]
MPNWTPEQEKVIKLRDRNILVSAGAGSGKTAVLVERIIKMITDDAKPVDVDKLVIVTFTKAAASEMRERIGAAISKALAEDPDNEHLQKQQTLLHTAKITTIDSFCMDLVRNYFHKIDLSPDFRIADESETKLLKKDVIDALLDDKYAEGAEDFINFVECFATGKSEETVKDIIIKMYEFSMSYADSKAWIRSSTANYDCETPGDAESNPVVQCAVLHAKAYLEGLVPRMEYLRELAMEPGGPYKYTELAKSELDELTLLSKEQTYKGMYEGIGKLFTGRLPGGKLPEDIDPAKKDLYQDIRNGVKKEIGHLKDKIISVAPEDIPASLEHCKKDMETIVNLAIEFTDRFAKAKRDRKIADFNDIEHFALQILLDENGNRTDVARQYASAIHEIFIDEYQDSNEVQDTILTAVSGMEEGRNNIFVVGDVKQSIYRFRMAKPELFMKKYSDYTETDSPCQRIDLHNNFRSRKEVIDSVNFFFRQLMHESVGKVEYDKAAELVCGAKYPESDSSYDTELMIITPGEDEKVKGSDKRWAEALAVAAKIKKMVENKEVMVKEGEEGLRPVRYGDIAILTRASKGWKEVFSEALETMDVPLMVSSTTGYFDTPEVLLVLSVLQIIDNPMQDIPLAAAMKSVIGGFTTEELAMIRAACKEGSFYDAVAAFCETEEPLGERLADFLGTIGEFRKMAVYLPVNELIEAVLDKTGYLDYITAKPGGKLRRENLTMLMEQAVKYEQTSYKGLFNFLRYIELLKKYEIDFSEPDSVETFEDKVRIMTIHKSKGLEFPVVFLCGMSKQFNKNDTKGAIVLHSELGAGIGYIDPVRRIKSPSIVKNLLGAQIDVDNLGEELRVLYVALTRAKEKLIMTAYLDDVEAKINKYRYYEGIKNEAFAFSDILSAGSYTDWIFMGLARGCDCVKTYTKTLAEVVTEVNEYKVLKGIAERSDIVVDPEPEEHMEAIREAFAYTYPYITEVDMKTKISVSELKKRAFTELDEEEAESLLAVEDTAIPYVPDFIEKREEHGGIRKGNVYHKIMECYDFTAEDLWKSFGGQLDSIQAAGHLDEEDISVVYHKSFQDFFATNMARRMQQAAKAGKLFREKPFVMSVPANSLGEDYSGDEPVIIQGIIDAYFEEDGEIVLIDYKTDRVDSPNDLVARYRVQLDLYEEAIRGFTGLPVKEKLIYSFSLGQEISL